MSRALAILVVIVAVVAILALSSLLGGAMVWAAWNWIAVPAFSAPPILFWQACLAALFLSFFFGGSRNARGSA